MSTETRGACGKVCRKSNIEGPRCPAQTDRKRLIFERIRADLAILVLRRVIERARRACPCTRIMGRAGTRGMFHPLLIRSRPVQRGCQFIPIRTFSTGSESTQQSSPKPFYLVGSGFLNILNLARLVGLLILPEVKRVVEQESDFCHGCGAVCELVAV